MPKCRTSSTVFVRNLDFSVDDQVLASHFDQIAPVKRAFIIRERGSDKSKGFGFVEFALEADAERVVESCNGQSWNNRELRIDIAEDRGYQAEGKTTTRQRRQAALEKQQKLYGVGSSFGREEGFDGTAPSSVNPPTRKRFSLKNLNVSDEFASGDLNVTSKSSKDSDSSRYHRKFSDDDEIDRAEESIVVNETSSAPSDSVASTWASPGVVLRAQRKHVRFDTPECDHVSDEGSRSKSISTSISEDAPPSAVRVESPRKPSMSPGSHLRKESSHVRFEVEPSDMKLEKSPTKKSRSKKKKESRSNHVENSNSAILLSENHDGRISHSDRSKSMTTPVPPSVAAGIRQIRFSHLPESVSMSSLRKKCGKFGKVVSCSRDAKSPSSAIVEFSDAEAAFKAVSKLYGSLIGDSKLMCSLDTEEKETLRTATREARLIIRNLPFSTTEESLRSFFDSSGVVLDVQLPRKEDGKLRGFGFVQFSTRKEAEEVVEKTNGKKFQSRVIAVDFSLPKAQYEKIVMEGSQETDETTESVLLDDVAVDDEDIEDAVDGDMDEFEEDKDEGREESSSSHLMDLDESTENLQAQIPDENQSMMSSVSHSHYPDGSCVFIRNIPFEATEDELVARMSEFGPVAYGVFVRDKLTGHPRGTGFVQFRSFEAASAAVNTSNEAERIIDKEMCLRRRKDRGDSLRNSQITKMELFDPHGVGILLHGRRIIVSKAVTKDQAGEIAQLKKELKSGRLQDRRNLYLAKLGYIEEGTPESEGVSKIDLEKRNRAWKDKKEKLKNPNFFISPTRLSIRNIPRHVNEAELRSIAWNTIHEYPSAKGPKASMKQVKIVREVDRIDPETGEKRSKGFGFIEFANNDLALAALQALNNNPKYFSKDSRLIVEFAVENHQALQKLKRTQQMGKVKSQDATVKSTSASGSSQLNKNDRILKKRSREDQEVGGKSPKTKIHQVASVQHQQDSFQGRHTTRKDVEKQSRSTIEPKNRETHSKSDEKRINVKKGKGRKEDADDRMFNRLVADYKKKLFGE